MKKQKLKSSVQLLKDRPLLFDSFNSQIEFKAEAVHEAVQSQLWQNYRRPLHYFNFAQDFEDLVSQYGRLKLCSMARNVYNNLGVIHGVVDNIATDCIGNGWDWMFLGDDSQWGKDTVHQLEKYSPRLDVRGNGRNFQWLLWQTQIAKTVDGDCLWIFTTSQDGLSPMFQIMPAQRLGNRDNQETISTGTYKGYAVKHGCIVNSYGRTLAYQLLGDTEDQDTIVPIDSCFLVFEPSDFTQFRGVSALASVLSDLRDYKDVRDFYKQVVKQDATLNTVIKTNQSVDTMADELGDSTVGSSSNPSTEPVYGKYISGPEIRVFRPNTGEDIDLKHPNRPMPQVMEFMSHILHSILAGMGWMLELEEPKELTSGTARYTLAKAQRIIAYKHQQTIYSLWQWATKKMVAHLMTTKQIPFNVDWFKWEPTPTRRLSVDYFRDVKSDIDSLNAGISNPYIICGQDGNNYDDVIEHKGKAYQKAMEVSKKYNVPIEILWQSSTQTFQQIQHSTQPLQQDEAA